MSDDTCTVVGAGAIGGTLAFHLARAGHPVRLVDTDPEHVAAINARGLTLSRDGARSSVPVKAVLPEDFDGTLGRVLLAVKAQATATALDWIAPRLAADGYVVSVQNGFNEDLIAARVGPGRTVAAFVNIFADVVEPGVVLDGGTGALVIGEHDGAPVSDRVRALVGDLAGWGPATASDNVTGYLWAKAAFGAMLAATALADAPMADLIDRHTAATHAVAAEVLDVADALGVRPEPFDAFAPDAFRRAADPGTRRAATERLTGWLRTQSKDRSGIWRDLAVRRRPVEVTTHYADVFTRAGQHGLATPVLRSVLHQLRELEADPAAMAESRLDRLDALATGPAHPAAPALRDWLAGHREQMADDVTAYARRESPSDDPAALADCLGWLRGWLDTRLGPADSEDVLAREDAGDILVRRCPGTGARPVLLLGHYDTVWPLGTLADWPVRRDGDLLTGPGVFDMKAGLVQAVWALRALTALGLPRPACTLLLNGDEETGSLASRDTVVAEARDSRCALVFEASADGAVKTARKGVGLFTVEVTGVEAHAGLDPEAGASAVDELARQLLRLAELRDPASGTSLNAGVVEGGTRANVTAGRATARLDIRVPSAAERERVDAALRGLRPADPRTTVTVTGGWNRPVFERTPAVAELAALARECAAPLGLRLRECAVGGASDGNFVAGLLPVLDGIGAVGAGAHARGEHISVDAMVERAALTGAVLTALADD